MLGLWGFIGPYTVPFFVIAVFLSARWLALYAVVASAGLAWAWWDHLSHGGGNGLAAAFAGIILLFATAALIAGVLVRISVQASRARGVSWRLAYLPVPAVLALLLASPWLAHSYGEFKRRPPSDACLAATHQLELGGVVLRVPTAPVFTVFRTDERREIYNLGINARTRAFCDLAAARTPMRIRLLHLEFTRTLPSENRPWPAPVCGAVRERDWLHRFCRGRVKEAKAQYPTEITFVASAERKYGGVSADLRALLDRADPVEEPSPERIADAEAFRLSAADGAPIAVRCRHYGDVLASCLAAYDPVSGLSATFQFTAGRTKIPAKAKAMQAKVREIFIDLRKP